MKLFLLSDTLNPNKMLKHKLSQSLNEFGNHIAYISSSAQELDRPWFNNTLNEFKNINPKVTMDYFDLSSEFSDEKLNGLKNYKIIYLSGGNTFHFLQDIRNRKLDLILKEHIDKDRLLIGSSAGSILMTSTIEIAGIADLNDIGMTNFESLNFVDFEFLPHMNEIDEKTYDSIVIYSKNSHMAIYLCKDEDGIYFEDGEINLLGPIKKMKNGVILD